MDTEKIVDLYKQKRKNKEIIKYKTLSCRVSEKEFLLFKQQAIEKHKLKPYGLLKSFVEHEIKKK